MFPSYARTKLLQKKKSYFFPIFSKDLNKYGRQHIREHLTATQRVKCWTFLQQYEQLNFMLNKFALFLSQQKPQFCLNIIAKIYNKKKNLFYLE